jgi:hypothetical protein
MESHLVALEVTEDTHDYRHQHQPRWSGRDLGQRAKFKSGGDYEKSNRAHISNRSSTTLKFPGGNLRINVKGAAVVTHGRTAERTVAQTMGIPLTLFSLI